MSKAQPSSVSALAISEYRPHKINFNPYKLESLFSNDMVQYKCSCDSLRRLNNTYFCRHCMALRCRSCVLHEVDSQYCQHCLEYIPTIDPKFQMNKCASCYQCPSCQHLLSTSVLSMSSTSSEQLQQDEVIRRTCQLYCEFCRWTSEAFQTEGSRIIGNLADFEVKNLSKIMELMDFYKNISQKEKADKKKRRFHTRSGNTMDLLKKYGIDNTLSPKLFESLRARTDFPDKSSPSSKYNLEPKSHEDQTVELFKPDDAVGVDEIEQLDVDFYYNKNFNLEDVGGIVQRLAQVEIQPEKVADFKPISKSLSVKRSLRCKKCERNLCRSEYSPVSIRFKIQSASYYHIPELRLRSDVYPIHLKLNQNNIVEFTLQNQTLSQVRVKLDKIKQINDDDIDVAESDSKPELDEDCDIVLPPSDLVLGAKDDTADCEHVPYSIRPLNTDTQVTFTGLFKLGFYIKIIPKKKVEKLKVQFMMSYDVVLLQNPRDNDKSERISHIVQVQLGQVVD